MAIEGIVEELATVYREHFDRGAGDLRIKRVTENVPEAVTEWPWLYFVIEEGDVDILNFAADTEATPKRRNPLPGDAVGIVRRNAVEVVHRFKAQLCVRPRRDLVEDESAVRPFIQPLVTLALENLKLGGLVLYCKPTGYRYGMLALGQVEGRAVEFVGLEMFFSAKEVV